LRAQLVPAVSKMNESRIVRTPLSAMTFNVRYDEPADGSQAWSHRRELVIETIRSHDPDLIGLQEPTASQFDEIAAGLVEYTAFGLHTDEWGGVEPHGGFFRAERFELRASGLFWLSETPDIAHSVSWDNDWGPRACGWVRLRDRLTDRELVFASTHVDTNAGSWLPSAQVLHRELALVAGHRAIVLVGDFNCPAGTDAYRCLLSDGHYRDAWLEGGRADDDEVTYHGFTGATRLTDRAAYPADAFALHNYRIDWILVRGELTCMAADIDIGREEDVMPSDHYPVVASLEWSDSPRT
jgi:endonuclease/exonuclease/phosphatase family metal-dependent hydrolase